METPVKITISQSEAQTLFEVSSLRLAALKMEIAAFETLVAQLRIAAPDLVQPATAKAPTTIEPTRPKEIFRKYSGDPTLLICPQCQGPKSAVAKLCQRCNQAKVNAARNAAATLAKAESPAPLPTQSTEDRQVDVSVATVKAAIKNDNEAQPTYNSGLTPTMPAALKIGLSLSEPFSGTDLAARLDSSGPYGPNQRAHQWIATWKAQGKIDTCGFGQYRRTRKFKLPE